MPSRSFLRSSLALWRRRWRYRRAREINYRQRAEREQAKLGHVTQGTQAEVDRWTHLRSEASDWIRTRKRQLAHHPDTKPRIITSSQLGLRFQYLWGGKGPLDSIAGHYDAGPQVHSDSQLIARARSIHTYHTNIGHGGAAYEALVSGKTIVFLNPMARKSAAVAGQNTGLASICVPGTTGDRMDSDTRRTVEWLIANWHTRAVPKAHRLPRRAKSVVRLPHREFPGQSTACPGEYVSAYRKAWS